MQNKKNKKKKHYKKLDNTYQYEKIIKKENPKLLLRQNIQFYTHSTKSTRRTRKRKQKTVYDNASELYNQYLKIYFNQ